MSTDKEWQRLCNLYAEKSDGELLALHTSRESLSEIAQQALEQTMHGRKLDPLIADADTSDDAEDFADTDGELLPNEIVLWRFQNGSEAARATAYLNEAEIRHRMLAREGRRANGLRSNRLEELLLVINRRDTAETESVLRETMGLFPLPEADGGTQLELLTGMTLLVMFQREFELDNALGLAATLAREGVSFLWRDGTDAAASLPDGDFIAIEVQGKSLTRAQALLEQFAATLPEAE